MVDLNGNILALVLLIKRHHDFSSSVRSAPVRKDCFCLLGYPFHNCWSLRR